MYSIQSQSIFSDIEENFYFKPLILKNSPLMDQIFKFADNLNLSL